MEIKAIAKADTHLIAVLLEDEGEERIFWICAPAVIRDRFADELAAYIVKMRLEQCGSTYTPRCPECLKVMYDDDGRYQCTNEGCENCR